MVWATIPRHECLEPFGKKIGFRVYLYPVEPTVFRGPYSDFRRSILIKPYVIVG